MSYVRAREHQSVQAAILEVAQAAYERRRAGTCQMHVACDIPIAIAEGGYDELPPRATRCLFVNVLGKGCPLTQMGAELPVA